MDFIERLFGLAPDAGSGATEALIVAAVVLTLVSLYRIARGAPAEG